MSEGNAGTGLVGLGTRRGLGGEEGGGRFGWSVGSVGGSEDGEVVTVSLMSWFWGRGVG